MRIKKDTFKWGEKEEYATHNLSDKKCCRGGHRDRYLEIEKLCHDFQSEIIA